MLSYFFHKVMVHIFLYTIVLIILQGFFCATEKDFDDLCTNIQTYIINGHKTPMFELHKERPAHWMNLNPEPLEDEPQIGN